MLVGRHPALLELLHLLNMLVKSVDRLYQVCSGKYPPFIVDNDKTTQAAICLSIKKSMRDQYRLGILTGYLICFLEHGASFC